MYAPLLQASTGIWFLGRIENHQAVPIELKEIEDICILLNNLSVLDSLIGLLNAVEKNEQIQKGNGEPGATDHN